jgi:hypothetical protein
MNKQELALSLDTRARALRGYKDMPGMRATRADGTNWRRGDLLWRQACATSLSKKNKDPLILDCEDPGTKGCLLELCRKAWGDFSLVPNVHAGFAGAWVMTGAYGMNRPNQSWPTEVQALVGCLEAAPNWDEED